MQRLRSSLLGAPDEQEDAEMMMLKRSLVAAIASTVCAALWLINCVIGVAVSACGSLRQDMMLTLVWAVCAVCWWMHWLSERKCVNDA